MTSGEKNNRRRVVIVLVVVAALVLVAATLYVALGMRKTPLYAAMDSDPMASEQLPGLALEADWSKDETSPFGVPSPSKVSRLFRVTDDSSETEKVAELEELAAREGWTEGEDPRLCAWEKTRDGFALCLDIRASVDPGQVVVEITPG